MKKLILSTLAVVTLILTSEMNAQTKKGLLAYSDKGNTSNDNNKYNDKDGNNGGGGTRGNRG